jgi:hypothetical protein
VPFRNDHTVIVCEADGRFAGTIGRFGNEFLGFINGIHVAADDSLVVLHDQAWVSVFDTAGKWVRGFKLEGCPSDTRLIGMRDGRVLVAVKGHEEPLPPLQLYDESGRLERSFGPQHFESLWGPREASWADDGSIWLPGPGYRIERCDLEGRVDRVIGVKGADSWYTDWSPGLFMTEEEFLANRRAYPPKQGSMTTEPFVVVPKPTPIEVLGVGQITDSFLLVAAHVFNPGTPSDPLPRIVCDPSVDLPQRPTPTELDFMFRGRTTLLDLIHIPTGEVRARTEIPGRCYLTADGTLWKRVVRENTVQVETFEVSIRDVQDAVAQQG